MTEDLDQFEPLRRLDRDLKKASRQLSCRGARNLVDFYYQIQGFRTAAANQVRMAKDAGEPNLVIDWVASSTRTLENDIKKALDEFTDEWAAGRWMKSIVGIGPVISAGFLATLDIRKAMTASRFWRYCGLDAETEWLGRKEADALVKEVGDGDKTLSDAQLLILAERARLPVATIHQRLRFLQKKEDGESVSKSATNVSKALSLCPWNPKLKRLCYLLGDCFMKFSNHKDQFYGAIFRQRREYEDRLNEAGKYADQAKKSLEEVRYGEGTEARKHYENGKLPPARMLLRAERYAVKMFLSHLHHVMYWDYFGKAPPIPYALEKLEQSQHRHYIPPPNFPWEGGGRSLRELLG